MSSTAPTHDEPRADLWMWVRVILSSPVLLAILLLAVSAAAEQRPAPRSPAVLPTLAARALQPAPPPARARILGLDLFALQGSSLVEDDAHHASGYTASWGRGPRARGQRALGLAWGWRF